MRDRGGDYMRLCVSVGSVDIYYKENVPRAAAKRDQCERISITRERASV